jgi:MYXO-CTERM domain-containing protein
MSPSYELPAMSLIFDRTAAQKKQLAKDLVAIQDPTSPTYHQWLTPAQFAGRYGASASLVAKARAWLTTQGLSVDELSPTANRLAFHGTVDAVERAFQTEIHRYQVGGEAHFAPAFAPSVPAELEGLVLGLHGVNDFRPPHAHPMRVPVAHASLGGKFALAPADWQTIYDVNPLYAANITGMGQKIAIVGQTAYNSADIMAFRQQFGLDTSNLPMDVLVPNTGAATVLDPDDLSESELDLEWSGAIAKDAQLVFVYTGDSTTNQGFFDALSYAVEHPELAPIVNVSFGGCEAFLAPSDTLYYAQSGEIAAMMGITVLIASGDSGAAGCDSGNSSGTYGLSVSFPASIPNVTAVGGSQLSYTMANQSVFWSATSSALSYIPESAWNQTFVAGAQGLGATGGGYSVLFPRPYWQAAASPSSMFRAIPDISFTASSYDTPYLISISWTAEDGNEVPVAAEALTGIGGTSASSPSFSGVLALLNQSINAPTPGLGSIGPVLYSLYTSAPTVFHDITTGSNVVPCEPGTPDCPTTLTSYEYGYNAAMGYDPVTGLGSLDVAKFVDAWTTLAPTSTTFTVMGAGAAEGTPLSFTANVGSNVTTTPMTGKVTFLFQTVDGSGKPDIDYELGEADIVAGTGAGGVETGVATLIAPAPVGLTGAATIFALYGGDSHYLASYSTSSSLMTTPTFMVAPASITLSPNQESTFVASGGVPPVSWLIFTDETCAGFGKQCAAFKTLTASSVELQAGGADGNIVLQAVDSTFAEFRVQITVSGTPIDGGVLIPPDAGVDSGHDAGTPPVDSGVDSFVAPPVDAGADSGDATAGTKDTGVVGDETGAPPPKEDASRSDASGSGGSSGGCAVSPASSEPDATLLFAFGLVAPLFRRRRR